MVKSVNKVILIGNVGADPEVRTFGNGGRVANLRIATGKKWRDKNSGEEREVTQWHTIAIFAEHIVRFVEMHVRKGSSLYIEGELETRKWQDQSGNDRYSTEVVLRPYSGELNILSGWKDEGSGGGNSGGQGGGNSGGQSGGQGGGAGNLDDEIPF